MSLILVDTSIAILENIYLFHNDFDFDHMKDNSKIKIYNWDF
jgi:hypothetical protein